MPSLLRLIALMISACLLCQGSLAASGGASASTKKYFVVAVHEWPPFSSQDAKYFGIAPRIISDILQSQGIEVKFRFMPWSDALDGIITEEYDGALIWVSSDLHHEAFLMSDALLEHSTALYYRKNMPEPRVADDLIGYRMGINSHYIYDASSYRLLQDKSMSSIVEDNDVIQFRNLLEGKTDFYLTPMLTSAPLLRNNFSKEEQNALTYSSNLFKFPPARLIVNRHRDGSSDFITEFNLRLNRMKNDGTIERYTNETRFNQH